MPFQSEKQRRYLWANEPEIARDWTDTYGSGIAKALGGRVPLWTGGFPDFFQMTPENISQARSLPWKDALALEKQYAYDPKYTGADKTSWLGHKRQGLRSLMGMKPEVSSVTGMTSNVGGATPLTRKLALGARGLFGPLGLGSAYVGGASALQENLPESLQGVLSEDIFSQGAMGAGAGITPEHAEILKYGDPIQTQETMGTNWSELDDVEARNVDTQRRMELARLAGMEQYPTEEEDEEGNWLTPQRIRRGITSYAMNKAWPMAAGIPGLMFSGLTGGLGDLGTQLRGGVSQNAFEQARNVRRIQSRIDYMKQRREDDEGYSKTNLANLLKQLGQKDDWSPPKAKPKPTTTYVNPGRPHGNGANRAAGTGTTHTGHGKSGMGRDPSDRMARGGLAALWQR